MAAVVTALALLVEYAGVPLPDHEVPVRPRAVDRVLQSDRDDVAVLEWPTNDPGADADAMFRSLAHGHRVVNGFSGFVPDWLRELSGLLSAPGPPLAAPEARAALRQIYPLRYLVVRLADLHDADRAGWLGLRQRAPALLRFHGTFGEEDLYEVVALPDRGWRLARRVSPAFLRDHPVLRVRLRPLLESAGLDQWVDVTVGGRPLGRIPVNAEAAGTVRLVPRSRVAPQVITLDYAYRRPPGARDSRYRIGGTGALGPGDLEVRSAGQPHGDVASIQLNGTDLSPNVRGYDLVALDSAGRVAAVEAFDTFGDPAASARLAAWVARLPAGTIVAGAVKDEASAGLTAEAIGALATLGVRGDLRGRYRESHAFVGVKGAPAGSALEALGPRTVGVVVGRPDRGLGMEVSAFELTAR